MRAHSIASVVFRPVLSLSLNICRKFSFHLYNIIAKARVPAVAAWLTSTFVFLKCSQMELFQAQGSQVAECIATW